MKMTKTQAIARARRNVSEIKPIGDSYYYSSWDESCRAWHQHAAGDYFSVAVRRSQTMIDIAREYLGIDLALYNGGKWTTYLDS